MNRASTIGGYWSAVGETAEPYFLSDRPNWKIPHALQVHQFILGTQSLVSNVNNGNSLSFGLDLTYQYSLAHTDDFLLA